MTKFHEGGGREFGPESIYQLNQYLHEKHGISYGKIREVAQTYAPGVFVERLGRTANSLDFVNAVRDMAGEEGLPEYLLRASYLAYHSSIPRRVVPVDIDEKKKVHLGDPLSEGHYTISIVDEGGVENEIFDETLGSPNRPPRVLGEGRYTISEKKGGVGDEVFDAARAAVGAPISDEFIDEGVIYDPGAWEEAHVERS